jgi:hypothetical protein
VRLRDLDCWPPPITDSQTFRVAAPNSTSPATLKRVGIYSIAGSPDPYLSIVVFHQGHDWHASIQDLPAPLMRRILATLRGHEGETMASLGDLEIVEL